MFATTAPGTRFDGRDVTDTPPDAGEVQGYALRPCPYCGTMRDPRFPFCCELAGEPAPRHLPLPTPQ